MARKGPSSVEHISLRGEYDLSRSDELGAALGRVDGSCPVLIDVRAVTYADSSFMRALAAMKASHPNCAMIIYGANPELRRMLTTRNFERLFIIADSRSGSA